MLEGFFRYIEADGLGRMGLHLFDMKAPSVQQGLATILLSG